MNSPALDIQASAHLAEWLAECNTSLVLTTYQTNRLFFVGRNAAGDRLAVNERLFDKPMGLFWQSDSLIMGCRYQIWQLNNCLPAGQSYEGGDRLYVPRQSWITGDINAHDVVIDGQGRLLFVNTDFSCLATLDPDHSFAPLWKPPFIGKLVAEDRCHLNGLALVDGEPTYMTACSSTDEAAGWRNHRRDGGVVMHLPSDSILARGLSMPHSPRWYRDRLWLLNSGTGELGYLEGEAFVPVAFCPGFVRGLAFVGHYAVVGLSKLRSTSFSGLGLEQRLADAGEEAQCGLAIIDLDSGAISHWLRFGNLVEELFDVVALPDCRQPRALGLQDDAIERLVSFPQSGGLVMTKPTAKRPSKGVAAPVAGLPRANRDLPMVEPAPGEETALALEGPVRYQRVFHLTPDNLKPYDHLTWPRLSERWAALPPRGELLGLSAAIQGQLVGFAIAERIPGNTDPERAELISLFVEPPYRHRGIGTRLLKELQQAVDVPIETNDSHRIQH